MNLVMDEIIFQLNSDHHRLGQILSLLQEQMTALEIDEYFDVRLTQEILDYIKSYPNVHHHPLEEYLFDRVRHHSEIGSTIKKLRNEHSKILTQTKACWTFFILWNREGELFDRQRAIEIGKSYVELQRLHMRVEDQEVFPFMFENLTDTDMREIRDYVDAASLFPDPFFDREVMARYPNISSNIETRLGYHRESMRPSLH